MAILNRFSASLLRLDPFFASQAIHARDSENRAVRDSVPLSSGDRSPPKTSCFREFGVRAPKAVSCTEQSLVQAIPLVQNRVCTVRETLLRLSAHRHQITFCALLKCMPNMTGRPGDRTMEMNGGSSAPHLACTPCVPLFVHCLIRVEADRGAFRLPGAGGDHFHCTVEPSPGHIRCLIKHFSGHMG